jgi:hypothetical protein
MPAICQKIVKSFVACVPKNLAISIPRDARQLFARGHTKRDEAFAVVAHQGHALGDGCLADVGFGGLTLCKTDRSKLPISG